MNTDTLSLPTTTNNQIYSKSKGKIYRFFRKIFLFLFCLGILFISTNYYNVRRINTLENHEFYLEEFQQEFKKIFQTKGRIFYLGDKEPNKNVFKNLYKKFNYKPIWTFNYFPNNNSIKFKELIQDSKSYGLFPSVYEYDRMVFLEVEMEKHKNSETFMEIRKKYELLMTKACYIFINHLQNGFIGLDSDTNLDSTGYYTKLLKKSLYKKNLKEAILSVQPKDKNYICLQRALNQYVKKIEISNDVFQFPQSSTDTVQIKEYIKKVLIHLGYLNEKESDATIMDALKKFQNYHGLYPDGKIDRYTIEQLQISTEYRFQQIALNLDRIRKEKEWTKDYVFVNIPSYKLRIFQNNSIKKQFNVVVGKPWTKTPEITSQIETIVTKPEWNVPKSITQNEIIPILKKDSAYLIRNNFKILDISLSEVDYSEINWDSVNRDNFKYYLVQNSGDGNALGLVKFQFPNPFRVYIHDTPSKKYFQKEIRTFSHGCVRLQNPLEFADYILKQDNQTKINLRSLITYGEKTEIALQNPINIYIRYRTCEADEDFNIYFYKDVYNYDKEAIDKYFNL